MVLLRTRKGGLCRTGVGSPFIRCIVAVSLAGLLVPSSDPDPAVAATSIDLCQQLAGDPDAPGSRGLGIRRIDQIQSIAAVLSCQKAIDEAPDNPSVHFNFGRASLAPGPLQSVTFALSAFNQAAGHAGTDRARSEIGEAAASWYESRGNAMRSADTHRDAAVRGDPLAQLLMAQIDRAASREWTDRALRQDYTLAYFMAAAAARPRWAEAARLLQVAAERGHSWSQLELFQYYRDGVGVPRDRARSEEMLANAARNGNFRAIAVYERRKQQPPAVAMPRRDQAPVVPLDPAAEVAAALAGATTGSFDTHFHLPLSQPLLFALAFEFADELGRLCPGLFPRDFPDRREVLWAAYVHYSFWRQDPSLPRQLPRDISVFEATARLVAQSQEAALPSWFRRRMIRGDVPLFARTLLERSGGCTGSDVKTIAGNLAAIGTFGTLPHHSLSATLLGREATANGAGFLCVYSGDDKASRKVQGYRLPDPINLLRDSPWGSYWEAINRQIDEGRYGKDRGTRPDIPFIRTDCPLTPDPRYRISTEYTLPTVPQLSGSIAERMSTYFVDYYIPHLGMRETGTALRLNPSDLQRLREEIIRFESIEVSRAEIEERIRETDARDRARGVRPMPVPPDIRRNRMEGSLRVEKYRAVHGVALFDLARPENGVPHYLVARQTDDLEKIRQGR